MAKKRKTPTKHTKKKGSVPKNPFQIGHAGKEFQPSKFGEHRGSDPGWASKLPFFGK